MQNLLLKEEISTAEDKQLSVGESNPEMELIRSASAHPRCSTETHLNSSSKNEPNPLDEAPPPTLSHKHKSSIDTFGWCPNSKHIDVDVEGVRILRRRNSQRYRQYPVCNLLRNMFAQDSSVQAWSIKINSCQHGILFGICLESQAKLHRFEGWYWAVLGHGQYLFWTGGSTYSHHNALENNKRIDSKLKTGDIARVIYEPSTHLLTISHAGTVLWRSTVQEPPQNDQYRGCVYLNEGDSVDIVQD